MSFGGALADYWSVQNTGAAATAATASKAAGAAGVKHIAARVICTLATVAATAQVPIAINLRDGATGAGTILIGWEIAALGTTFAIIDTGAPSILAPPGSAATAMTIEFGAANVANSIGSVYLLGYDNT